MSFLLSSFFAVPVSSTMDLPLCWVSSPSASSTGALLSWAPVVLGLFHVEVVSARLNPSHGTIDVTTGPRELSAEFIFRCPGFQHDGPSSALGFFAFRF